MSGKLIKYEFKATARFMLMIYALLIFLSVIISAAISLNFDDFVFGFSSDSEVFSKILTVISLLIIVLCVIMMVVVSVATFFYSINRFRKNLLENEGYLMHTLPVSAKSHIFSKTFVFTVWTFFSLGVVLLANMIIFFGLEGTEVFRLMKRAFSEFDIGLPENRELMLFFAEILVAMIFSSVAGFLHIFASMTVGYCSHTHRALKSFGIYILISMAFSVLESILGIPLKDFMHSLHGLLIFSVCLSVLKAAVCFVIANRFLTNRLNLQ